MDKYLNILEKVELFENIEPKNILSLLNCLSAKTVNYEKKQLVFMEGNSIDKVGIVLAGQLQIVKEDYFGNRNIVSILEEGDIFGETFVCSGLYSLPVSVVSITDCSIMFIDFGKLSRTCSNTCAFHSMLILNMMRVLAIKNINLNQKILITSKRTTREKLLAFLSSEAEKAGSGSFEIPLNRQELADYLSVDRSAMSAELSRMADEKIIKYNKNSFTLL